MSKYADQLAAVGELAGIDPAKIKGYVLAVDDGSRQATVVTDLPVPDCTALFYRVTEVLVTGTLKEGCTDYDPDHKLHGCELDAHAADKPHRDLLGNEWRESLQLPCPSISNEGVPCGLHSGHFPAKHRPAACPVWENEWTDAIYEASGPRKAAPRKTVVEVLSAGEEDDVESVVYLACGDQVSGDWQTGATVASELSIGSPVQCPRHGTTAVVTVTDYVDRATSR